MGNYDTKLVIGDDWQRTVEVIDAAGTPVTLTGWAAVWSLRESRDGTPVATMATATGEIVVEEAVLIASLRAAVTGTLTPGLLYHDLVITDVAGLATTFLSGRVLAT